MDQAIPLSPLRKIPQRLADEYARKRPTSLRFFQNARNVLPGGQTRSVTHYLPFPSIISEGNGHTLRDVDGHEYVDLLNNYTSLVHGNAFSPATAAVSDALSRGTAFASIHPAQIELAEKLTSRVSSLELVRFTNSGSEASALAARVARRYTGRSEIIVARGGYHGAVPPFSDPGSDHSIKYIPYNDTGALAEAVSERTAAVFLEPFQGAGGVIEGSHVFLNQAAQICRSHDSLFVLDEVQSLRNNFGGMQDELESSPDLTLLGKIIGGGFPIGAVGGRADVLEETSPFIQKPLSHAGTFNGHIAAAIAGKITLDHLDQPAITSMNQRAASLQRMIEDSGRHSALNISVTRSGSILNVYSGDAPSSSALAMQQPIFHDALHLSLMLEGIYTATRGMINLSTVIHDELLEEIGRRYSAAFARLTSYSDSEWE